MLRSIFLLSLVAFAVSCNSSTPTGVETDRPEVNCKGVECTPTTTWQIVSTGSALPMKIIVSVNGTQVYNACSPVAQPNVTISPDRRLMTIRNMANPDGANVSLAIRYRNLQCFDDFAFFSSPNIRYNVSSGTTPTIVTFDLASP